MAILDDRRLEFVAKNIADLGKAILAVSLASYFFERFPLWLRWALPASGFGLLLLNVFVHPRQQMGSK